MRLTALFFLAGVLVLATPSSGSAQCLLANPSFEIPGTGGSAFGGWNQFGLVGDAPLAHHGSNAVRVTGPSVGSPGLSAVWQPLDATPGETWTVLGCVAHSASNPLAGSSTAIVNVEWRDGGGALISFESHVVATPASPVNVFQSFAITSGPAPLGTTSTRVLLGALQPFGDPAPDVYFDEIQFREATPIPLEAYQWSDFPGGRTLDFSGRTWRVKGPGLFGPGPNLFSDSPSATWVDLDGRLHLTIQNLQGAQWYSTEVTLEEPLGYGDYVFTTYGRLDTLEPNVVLGLFLWQYQPCFSSQNEWWGPYQEIDIEFSRWGDPNNDVGQFVAQPFSWPGNIDRFAATFVDEEITSHAFCWQPDRVEFRSWRGGPGEESPATLIHEWTYSGPHIPRPVLPRVHLNLWYFGSAPNTSQEVVLDRFTFVPLCSDEVVSSPDVVGPMSASSLVAGVAPNPFRARTTVWLSSRFNAGGEARIFDVTGRLIRTLRPGRASPGSQFSFEWNGRSDAGTRVGAGVYFLQLRSGTSFETRRLVRVR